MKKITAVIFAFCLLGLSLTAQEKIAIIPFTGGSGDQGNAIAQILKTEFTELGNFQIAPNTQAMDKVLEDKNIQKTGLLHGDTIVRLGKSANADYIVSGHIQSLGHKKIVLASLIHIKTYQQIAGDYYEYSKFEDAINYLPTLAEKLVSKTKMDYLSLPTLVILPFHGAVEEKATGLKRFFSGRSSSKANDNNPEFLRQLLAIEIANSGKYAVISREQTIANIMEEQNIKIRNLADVTTATKLGKEVNSQYILSGTVSPIGTDDLMNVSIIEVSSLAQESGAYVRYKTIGEGARLMLVLSSELTGILSETTLSSETALSLEDALALYENDEAERDGKRIIEITKKLVANDIDRMNLDHNNYTPLMYASRYGYTELIKSLIAAGSDIEANNTMGYTALILATERGHTEAVAVLIDAGANIEAKDKYGITVLTRAAINGYTEIVKTLIAEGAEVNTKDDDGNTALMFATKNGKTEVAEILIEAGAGINVKSVTYNDHYSDIATRILMFIGLSYIIGGAIVFGFYYLLYKLTVKIKNNVQITSLVVRAPLIIGWVNLLSVALFVGLFFILYRRQGSEIFIPLFLYVIWAIIPISIGSSAISFFEYKRKLITSMRLRIIVLMNIISILLILLCIFTNEIK